MTGNPIFVRYGMAHLAQCEDWEWTCTRCRPALGTYGFEWTAGAAADAGREHMRRHHGYSRRCGVSLAACGAQTCRCVSVDPDAENGPHRAAGAFDAAELQNQINCAVDRMNAAMNGVIVAPLVDAARAFAACDRPDCPICATHNALQTTHHESRDC